MIGGGQSGLAMEYQLTQDGRRFEMVDAAPDIGHVWRSRWDSLRLFTSARYDKPARATLPGDRGRLPGQGEVADYLKGYASQFRLPVRLNTTVTSLSRTDDVCTLRKGARKRSRPARCSRHRTLPGTVLPAGIGPASADAFQLHSSDYRRPDDLPLGRVLVVGASNSGCQIAAELSTTRTVDLSVGQRLPTIPQRPLGRDVSSWATALHLDRDAASSRLGRRPSKRDQIAVGPQQLSLRHAVQLRPRVTRTAGRAVTFADGSASEYDTVLWTTGFTQDNTWIDLPGITDEQGRIHQLRGITPSPGLYTLVLSWQHTRGPALLEWVGNDAAFIAQQIEARTS